MTTHTPVFLKEAVNALVIRPDGIYVDGTFGRGGHSQEILSRLSADGRLIAVDKDPQAVAVGQAISDRRFLIVHRSFATLTQLLANLGVGYITGLLLDLGVSSPQLDDPMRGFSFRLDGPLDMRMDTTCGITAAQWLNNF